MTNNTDRFDIVQFLKDTIFIVLGILSAGFGLKGFLLPNGFIDGGVTGISLLINEVTDFSLPVLVVVINVPFIILGYFQINRLFVIKSILAIVGLAIAISVINYPIITSDKLLVAVFGGFFLGAGIGLSVRGGGVLDGTEVLAIYFGRKTGLSIGDFMLVFNIFVFSAAAYFLSIEVALYAILTYLAASKTVDFIIEGVEEYIGVTIISPDSEIIKKVITQELGKGITIYDGRGGYGKHGVHPPVQIIYCVITRLEIGRFQNKILHIDPKAFIVMNSVTSLKGGMIKKRQFHND